MDGVTDGISAAFGVMTGVFGATTGVFGATTGVLGATKGVSDGMAGAPGGAAAGVATLTTGGAGLFMRVACVLQVTPSAACSRADNLHGSFAAVAGARLVRVVVLVTAVVVEVRFV